MKSGIRERLISDLFLLLAAAIWGFGFVAQRVATFHLGYFGFNAVRFLMAGIVLLPFVLKRFGNIRKTYGWVLVSGLILFLGSALQQAGLESTTAGAAGFITGVYVILVPILLTLFWKKKASAVTWISAVAAFAGTYLLSTGGTQVISSTGNILVFVGAFLWALHVIVLGMAVQRMDVFAFSASQFLVCGLLHLFMSFFVEPLTLSAIKDSWMALVYAGLISAAIGFTLQAVGQRKALPSDAALILSFEAVFAALAGILFLEETMNWIQLLGSGLILAAILFAQFAGNKRQLGTQPVIEP